MKNEYVRTHLWRLIALGALVGLLLALVGGPAAATPPRPLPSKSGDIMVHEPDIAELAAARPWTKEEMEAAIPYPLPEVEAKMMAELESWEPSGAPGAIPGALPGGIPLKATDNLLGFGSGASLLGYSYPPPYTRYEIFVPYTTWPYVTIGKLFFKQFNVSYVCSAAVVDRYTVWTAGHCVHAGNNSSTGWSTNVVFVPAYKDGSAPKLQWFYYTEAVATVWYQGGNPNGLKRDVGAIVLRKNSGYGVGNNTGWLGLAWNQGRTKHWNLFGYPAAFPFNGQRMWTCQASLAYLFNYGTSGPMENVVGCDMTGGCSGGPWILSFSGGVGATNYINGNNSFRRSGYTHELASPYLDDIALSLYNWFHPINPP